MKSPVSRTTVFWAVFVLTALNLLDYFDRYIVAAVNTLIKQDLGLSDKAFGFLGSAFFLVYLIAAPVFGYLGDRWGRRRFMVMGAVLWSLATSLAFWVTTYPGLVIARGLVGMGEGSFGTLAPAYLADMLPLGKRARYLGIFYTTIPVGAALAYFFGGQVGAAWGWRWSFLLAGLPGLIMAGLVYTLPRLAAPGADASLEQPGLRLNLKMVAKIMAHPHLCPGDHRLWVPHLCSGGAGLLDAPVPGNTQRFDLKGGQHPDGSGHHRGRRFGDAGRRLWGGLALSPQSPGPSVDFGSGRRPGPAFRSPGDIYR